jgi:hypothetical protein
LTLGQQYTLLTTKKGYTTSACLPTMTIYRLETPRYRFRVTGLSYSVSPVLEGRLCLNSRMWPGVQISSAILSRSDSSGSKESGGTPRASQLSLDDQMTQQSLCWKSNMVNRFLENYHLSYPLPPTQGPNDLPRKLMPSNGTSVWDIQDQLSSNTLSSNLRGWGLRVLLQSSVMHADEQRLKGRLVKLLGKMMKGQEKE